MKALIFDRRIEKWESSRGFIKADVPEPVLDEKRNPGDRGAVLIKVRYAGVCGSDRGIWYRQAFRDQILRSLALEKKQYRIIGHEFFGEIVAVGSRAGERYALKRGDAVSAESHVVCNACFQCRIGQKNVCTNEKILGISHDGCFAEYIKIPAHIVWKTDIRKIRPEIAAIQEPFGNAVHAATKVKLRGKTIALFGLGPIGLFALLVARGLGAKKILGVEPNPAARAMAKKLGIDELIPLRAGKKEHPWASDAAAVREVLKRTEGRGVDIAFEMSGYNSSVNNAIASARRGGDVILFGLKTGDFVLERYDCLVVRGVTLHAVIGRELWRTWETTRALLQNKRNNIQSLLWNVLLKRGRETILSIEDYTNELFEKKMLEHTKILVKF